MGFFSRLFGKSSNGVQKGNYEDRQKIIKEIIVSKGLCPLGNKKRLTQTDNEYDVRLFLFAHKDDSEEYYRAFIDYAEKNPPPFCIEIMHARIHTIHDEPFGLFFPYERTDTRPEYVEWFREANLTCNEVLCNFQAVDHCYEMLNKYVKELFDWTILTPTTLDFNSPEAADIFSDSSDSGFTPLKVK
ncbi:MAG: hypothetical protein P9L97_04895 [Candidatus Tenebribacter davisii]|jgi:hypothetical protein|nr:hypothetical protein [Candidatus Tenebribacter davisii]